MANQYLALNEGLFFFKLWTHVYFTLLNANIFEDINFLHKDLTL